MSRMGHWGPCSRPRKELGPGGVALALVPGHLPSLPDLLLSRSGGAGRLLRHTHSCPGARGCTGTAVSESPRAEGALGQRPAPQGLDGGGGGGLYSPPSFLSYESGTLHVWCNTRTFTLTHRSPAADFVYFFTRLPWSLLPVFSLRSNTHTLLIKTGPHSTRFSVTCFVT